MQDEYSKDGADSLNGGQEGSNSYGASAVLNQPWVPLTSALMWISHIDTIDIDFANSQQADILGQPDEHIRCVLERAWAKLAAVGAQGLVVVRGRRFDGSEAAGDEIELSRDDLLNCKWFSWAVGDEDSPVMAVVQRFKPDDEFAMAQGGLVNFSSVRVERDGLMRLWPAPDRALREQASAIKTSFAVRTSMRSWLEQQLDDVPVRSRSKNEFWELASRDFNVNRSAFDTAWRIAVESRPDWQVAGRRRRSANP